MEAAGYASHYMLAFLPGLYLQGYTDAHRRYLNGHGHNSFPLACLVVATVVQFCLSYYLIIELKMGITGTAVSGVLTNLMHFILQHSVAAFLYPSEARPVSLLDSENFSVSGITAYLKLGLPSIALVCVDWWSFEAMLLVSGLFGVQKQAAMIVLMNMIGQTYRIGQGLD